MWNKSSKALQQVLQYATSQNLPLYEGKAYLYMGQYHLYHGTPKESTPYLEKAFSIFHKLNDVANREFVQNLAAVSKGYIYIEIIL